MRGLTKVLALSLAGPGAVGAAAERKLHPAAVLGLAAVAEGGEAVLRRADGKRREHTKAVACATAFFVAVELEIRLELTTC